MGNDRWQKVEQLLSGALSRPADERGLFLDEACGADPELRREVESLLAWESRDPEFLDRPAAANQPSLVEDAGISDLSGKSIAHYQVLSKLGEGGMGIVYSARDSRLDRHVALKLLPDEFAHDTARLARLEREAKILASLSHPNVATLYGLEESDGKRFIVMELIEGQTLAQRLSKGPLPVDEALEVCRQIAEGLEAAHEKGVIHRDIKPANIFITPSGQAKILDFGLAKLVPAKAVRDTANAATKTDQDSLTSPGAAVGTVAYMSPEQALGKELDARTDLFSLGVVLYEMTTGALPFKGDSSVAMFDSILHKAPTAPVRLNPECPAALGQVINRLLEKDRDLRYQHAADLRAELKRLKRDSDSGQTVTLASPIRVMLASPTARRLTLAVIAAVAILAAVVGLNLGDLRYRILGRIPTPPIQSLAVLPLRNLSGDPDQEFFSDGMTEELITSLARIGSIRVVSRTSVMEYKGGHKKIPAIAKELKVNAILEGSVMRSGGRVRITAQLIDAISDRHLWADSYERELENVLALQSEIATRIAQAIKIHLTPEEKAQFANSRTVIPEAYQAYLAGRELARSGLINLTTVRKAVDLFQRAVGLDPAFGDAYAELTKAHAITYHMGYDRTDERITRARQALDHTLRLKADSVEAHLASGSYQYHVMQDYDRAIQEFNQARQQAPNNPEPAWAIAFALRRKGDFQGAVEALKDGLRSSPRFASRWAELGLTYSVMRKYSDADDCLDRATSIAPDDTFTRVWRARNRLLWNGDTSQARVFLVDIGDDQEIVWERMWIDLYEGNFAGALEKLRDARFETFTGWPADNAQFMPTTAMAGIIHLFSGRRTLARSSLNEARIVLERRLKDTPGDQRIRSCLGIVLAGLGLKEGAMREGQRAVEIYPASKDAFASPFLSANLAFIYTLVGEEEAAVRELHYLLSIPCHQLSVPLLRIDPRWNALRTNLRFQRLLERREE